MSTIVVQAFITLDGVVQAGGGPDEDGGEDALGVLSRRLDVDVEVVRRPTKVTAHTCTGLPRRR